MLASTAHFEHGLPLLASLDLGKLFAAYQKLQADQQDLGAITDLVHTIGGAAEARILRKLSAVHNATFEQLYDSESNPSILGALEKESAAKPFTDTIQDAVAFFVSLGLSKEVTQGSLKAPGKARKTTRVVIPDATH